METMKGTEVLKINRWNHQVHCARKLHLLESESESESESDYSVVVAMNVNVVKVL